LAIRLQEGRGIIHEMRFNDSLEAAFEQYQSTLPRAEKSRFAR
jgi:hypothetical protein